MVGTPLDWLTGKGRRKSADWLGSLFVKMFLIILAIAAAISSAVIVAAADPIRLTPIALNESESIGDYMVPAVPSGPIVLKPIELHPIVTNATNATNMTNEVSLTNITGIVPVTNISVETNADHVHNASGESNASSGRIISVSDASGIYPVAGARIEGKEITVGKNVSWISTYEGDTVTIPSTAFGLVLPDLTDDTMITSGNRTLSIKEFVDNMERIRKIQTAEAKLAALREKRARQNIIGRVAIDLNSIGMESSIESEKRGLLNLSGRITMRFSSNATRIVQYMTEAPKKTEMNITSFRKYVNISSSMHYSNVTAYTDLTREVSASKIEIYWIINGTRVPFRNANHTIRYIDSNKNGLIDRIEWLVPHLSSQVFEIITRVTAAYDMDEMKNPLSDVQSLVGTEDNVSAEIVDTHYFGIMLERQVDSTKSIILYANSTPGTEILVYTGGKDSISTLTNTTAYGRYEISLENLTGLTDQIYIKVNFGTLYVDYVTTYPPTGNMSAWDDTNDAKGKNETYYENEPVGFYANMTNGTGDPIFGADNSCWIAFNVSGGWSSLSNMTYNSTTEVYEYFASFAQSGHAYYNITCYSGSGGMTVKDDFMINTSMPDYTMKRIMQYNETSGNYNISLVITSRTPHRYTLRVYDYLEKGFIPENYSITPAYEGNYTDGPGGQYDGRYMIWNLQLTAYENRTITYDTRRSANITRTDMLFGMG